MRETEVWDRGVVYGVWFETEREDGNVYVNVARVVMGDPATGEDVPVDLDDATVERLRDAIAERIAEGGLL